MRQKIRDLPVDTQLYQLGSNDTIYFYFSRVTNLVQISSEGEEGMMYQPGDHLYIYPENDRKHVEKLLKRVRCETDMDELVMVEQTSSKLPEISLRTYLLRGKFQKSQFDLGKHLEWLNSPASTQRHFNVHLTLFGR